MQKQEEEEIEGIARNIMDATFGKDLGPNIGVNTIDTLHTIILR